MSKEKDQAASGNTAEKEHKKPKRDYSYTQNRELSWLRFDDRVLDEAFDPEVPIFERLKFCEIFDSNLNEWFMIRVGGLTDLASLKSQPKDNKSNMTPAEQLDLIFKTLPPLVERHEKALSQVESELAKHGVQRVSPESYTDADLVTCAKHFAKHLSPIISPMIVDPRHPFPNLRSGRLYVVCTLDSPSEKGLLGVIEVPRSEKRVVELPQTGKAWRYTLVEDVLRTFLNQCFGDYVPKKAAVLRVTRNADIDPDGEGVQEEEDYRQHMKKILKLRQRLQPVRLEIQGKLDKQLESFILDQLDLEPRRVFHVSRPLDLGFVYGLEAHIPNHEHSSCVFVPFEPQTSPMVDLSKPMRPQVEDHDILLTYPYESMTPFLRLVREASADDSCISIKITLYRVAKSSHLCESLIAAADAGKDVTVLMELRARFDEANNIAWAERLEDAGCTVIYGSEGFKCHSKICQITYHGGDGIRRITCLGTGNFNEKTVKLYSDFMLLTANDEIAEDGNTFFRNLSLGNLRGTYKRLGVAPTSLKPLVMRGLEREMTRAREGKPAAAFFKMNSLTDRDVIDKISEACEAGVKVVMVIRGICCIRANVPDKTDGLVVRQIVGRFLEHARIYAFGADTDIIYLSSADMMTRNTERRVEIAFPLLDHECRKIVRHFIDLQLEDNVKARELTPEGTWKPIRTHEGERRVNSQSTLLLEAYTKAREAEERRAEEAAAAHAATSQQAAPEYAFSANRGELPSPKAAIIVPGDRKQSAESEDETPVEEYGRNVAEETAATEAEKVVVEATDVEHVNGMPVTDVEPAASSASTEGGAEKGRLARAASLFGQAFKTLFGGKDGK